MPIIQPLKEWGSGYENEVYTCKLFDSILKGYPIGGLIVWNTEEVSNAESYTCSLSINYRKLGLT